MKIPLRLHLLIRLQQVNIIEFVFIKVSVTAMMLLQELMLLDYSILSTALFKALILALLLILVTIIHIGERFLTGMN